MSGPGRLLAPRVAGFVSWVLVFAVVLALASVTNAQSRLRPPATPLVTIDPYTSCWSMVEELAADWPRHWTGRVHAMCGFVRVDGRPYRFLGSSGVVERQAQQLSLEVRATQSVYQFAAGPIKLAVTFTSPLLLTDLELLSRPVSYVKFDVVSADGDSHDVAIYFDATAEWAVNQPGQQVVWQRANVDGLDAMRIGTQQQKVLGTKGDDVRIDWGYLYVAAPTGSAQAWIADDKSAREAFASPERGAGTGPQRADDTQMPRAANDRWPVLSLTFALGKVGAAAVRRHVIVAYDDIYAVEYFEQKLTAWWRRDANMTFEKMLAAAEKESTSVLVRCDAFDRELAARAAKSGSDEYVALCLLAYRQAVAAHKLVAGPEGQPLFFSKENFSNGSIGTVDVTYPSAPLFLLYNPALVRGMMEPIFFLTESGRWKKPFAAHDVGTYPLANGQTYPEDMPVEECGNMLILAAAIAKAEGNPQYAERHWKALTQWAEYLEREGFDPANQLCTDDFAGHLAHDANLSIKAIVALGSYAQLARALGHDEVADKYAARAKEMAGKWSEAAGDGDHTRLTFDRAGTWSQKYNLVWDELLGLNLFPPELAQKEVAYYLTKQNDFGLPLDSRKTYTKSDWIVWSASMARSAADFQALIHPIYRFVNEGPSRIPISDWHETTNGKSVGFRARSVVGGYYMKILMDDAHHQTVK